MSRKTRRFSAVAAAALVGAASLLGFATSAHAADANINESTPRSLTIHKFEQPAVKGTATDGTEQDTTGLTPMEGVEFTISQVTAIGGTAVDLTDTASWDAIAPYIDGTNTFDPAGATMTALTPEETDANGAASFTDLPLGLYWVQETGFGDYNVTNAMKPFLVTVPLPGAAAGDWVYDVHAYPKNSVSNAQKTVDNSAALGLGSNVQWTVTGDIPVLGAQELTSYVIADTLPAGMSHTGTSQTVTVRDAGGDAVAGLVSPADYAVVTSGQVSTLTFTSAGLVKLKAAQGGVVEFSLATSVSAIGTGTLVNNAVVTVNDVAMDVSATTTWGAVNILKHVEGDTADVLGGAEFQVFASLADATARTNPISVAGTSTFVTDGTTGRVSIDGLYAATGGTSYWLVETKAPLGYLANTTPQEIIVTPGTIAAGVQVAVPNTQAPPATLPNLGGTGMVLVSVIGAAAVAGGVILALTGRRKKAAAQA